MYFSGPGYDKTMKKQAVTTIHRKIFYLVFGGLAGLCLPLWAQTDHISNSPFSILLIKQAQSGNISCLLADSTNDRLFSASEDGTVNVLTQQGTVLSQHLQIGLYPIIRLAYGPMDQLAALERLPGNSFRLSIWNFRTATQLYAINLNDQVQFLGFSPKGNFIIISLSRMDGLSILDLQNGTFLPGIPDKLGMVDFALMSSKEDRIMTYRNASGLISYHYVENGTELKIIPSKAHLSAFQLLPDASKTKAVAIDGNALSIIDLVGGSVLDSKVPGFPITQILTDDRNPSHIRVYGGPSGAIKIIDYLVDSNGKLTASATIKSGNRINCACLLNGVMAIGENNGNIVLSSENESHRLLGDRVTMAISGVAFSSQALYLNTAQGTVKINSDLFTQSSFPLSWTHFEQQNVSAIPANQSLLTLNDKEILFWDGSRSPRLNKLDTKRDQISKSSNPNNGTFLSVHASGELINTVDSNGGLRLWSQTDLRSNFSFNSQGAFCSVPGPDHYLLVGQGSSNLNDISLKKINLKTNETNPLNLMGHMVLQAIFNPLTQNYYFLSISSQDNHSLTNWFTVAIDGMGSSVPLVQNPISQIYGEDAGADIQLATDNSVVWSSIGGNNISFWDGNKLGSLFPGPHAPRKLATFRNWLAAVNSDGSVSLYHGTSKTLIADIYISTHGTIFLLDTKQRWAMASRVSSGNKVSPPDSKERSLIGTNLSPAMAEAKEIPITLDFGEISFPWTIEN